MKPSRTLRCSQCKRRVKSTLLWCIQGQPPLLMAIQTHAIRNNLGVSQKLNTACLQSVPKLNSFQVLKIIPYKVSVTWNCSKIDYNVTFMLKGRENYLTHNKRRKQGRMKMVNAVATHHGDSWPARQPPCWHSGDSCGSVPCAPPVNCAACSFVHSSCTCEVYPLRRELKVSVLSSLIQSKITS